MQPWLLDPSRRAYDDPCAVTANLKLGFSRSSCRSVATWKADGSKFSAMKLFRIVA